jgi:hypothetical protein
MTNEATAKVATAKVSPGGMQRRRRGLERLASVVGALSLIPALSWASPTPPPPAPPQKLGQVKVIEETRGTRKIVDAAGHVHVVMKRVTPAERKAAALRARASREAIQKHHAGPVSKKPASRSEKVNP